MAMKMVVNIPNLTFLNKRAFLLLKWLNSWFSEKAGWGVRGVMGRDWVGRGVYWQSVCRLDARAYPI